MKNTKSLNALIAVAAVAFLDDKNKGINTMYASEDGFTFNEENRAVIHCKSVPGMKYHPITRAEALRNVETQEVDAGDQDPDPFKPEADQELQELKTQYEELFGKAAHHNVGVEKLKTLIAEKLAESKVQKPEGGDNDQQPE